MNITILLQGILFLTYDWNTYELRSSTFSCKPVFFLFMGDSKLKGE